MKERKELKVKYIFEKNEPQLEAGLSFLTKHFKENYSKIKEEYGKRKSNIQSKG